MRTTFAVIAGAIIYRIIYALALRIDFLDTGDMKLITAVIVILALVVPQIIDKQTEKNERRNACGTYRRTAFAKEGGNPLAEVRRY